MSNHGMPRSRYPPIEDHGLIGDLHSVALVANDGTIDQCCLPHFDSPSLFAALLDADRGGHFRIAPTMEAKRKQMYFADTNILTTRFLCEGGVGEVIEFMPASERRAHEALRHQIVRVVQVARGTLPFLLECEPAFDYGRMAHRIDVRRGGAHQRGLQPRSRDRSARRSARRARPLKARRP